jgi:hypothetical protein
MPYALCPMAYALCPIPYALCPISSVHRTVTEKGYIHHISSQLTRRTGRNKKRKFYPFSIR